MLVSWFDAKGCRLSCGAETVDSDALISFTCGWQVNHVSNSCRFSVKVSFLACKPSALKTFYVFFYLARQIGLHVANLRLWTFQRWSKRSCSKTSGTKSVHRNTVKVETEKPKAIWRSDVTIERPRRQIRMWRISQWEESFAVSCTIFQNE